MSHIILIWEYFQSNTRKFQGSLFQGSQLLFHIANFKTLQLIILHFFMTYMYFLFSFLWPL